MSVMSPRAWRELTCVKAVGLMSGTSMDGVDVAIVELYRDDQRPPALLAFDTIPYPTEIHTALQRCLDRPELPLDHLLRLHWALGHVFAGAALEVAKKAGIAVANVNFIASHGQTVRHLPQACALGGFPARGTLQLGEAAVLAEVTGKPVVFDFRANDMALGGQGAPLVPFFDFQFCRSPVENRVIVNIGGIANLTWLPAGAQADSVVAGDCGPGNAIMDALCRRFFQRSYDHKGTLASQGRICHELLVWALRHPFFQLPMPRSADVSDFTGGFLEEYCKRAREQHASPQDMLATACELTALTIAESIKQIAAGKPFHVYVGGGGARNSYLVQRLEALLSPATVQNVEALGVPADAKEAIAFAYLGFCFLRGVPSALPQATGAKKHALTGKLALPSPAQH